MARDIYHSMSKIDIYDVMSKVSNNSNNRALNVLNVLSSEGVEVAKSIFSCIRQFTEYRFSNANRALTCCGLYRYRSSYHATKPSILEGSLYDNGYVLDIEEKDINKSRQ